MFIQRHHRNNLQIIHSKQFASTFIHRKSQIMFSIPSSSVFAFPYQTLRYGFGSVAAYQYFHTLIFVSIVSCSTRQTWDCSGLHALRMCMVGHYVSLQWLCLMLHMWCVQTWNYVYIYIWLCCESTTFSPVKQNKKHFLFVMLNT